MRETNACLCTLKTKKTSRTNVFCETFGHVFWGISVRRQKIKQLTMLRVPWALFFCLKLFLESLSAPPKKGGETACVCVCFVFILIIPTAFFHHVFVSCFQVTKKNGLRNGFDHSPFPCIKDSRTRGIIHITILFSRPKMHDENNKNIQHNIWHTLHDSNILLSNIRSLRSKSWNGYWEISWLWKLNESKRREGLEGLLLGRVPHWEGWDVGFAVKYCTRWCFWIFCIFTPSWGNDLIWQAYFSHGWFNHQLGNPLTLNPYSRQKRRDL